MTESHSVRVDRNKFNALDIRRNHPVYGIVSAAAYSDDLNIGAYFDCVVMFENHL
jgi:hypothetical protein